MSVKPGEAHSATSASSVNTGGVTWHSGWALFVQILVAIGTIGLAGVTTFVVIKTRDLASKTSDLAVATTEMATAARDEADLSLKAFQASIRPWLTTGTPESDNPLVLGGPITILDNRAETSEMPPGVYAYITVRNVGSGLAILHPSISQIFGWDASGGPKKFTSGAVKNPIMPPNEERTIEFVIVANSAAWGVLDMKTFTNQRIGSMQGTDGQFYVEIVYGDAMQELTTRAKFHFAYVKDVGWVTNSITYFTPPESTDPEVVAEVQAFTPVCRLHTSPSGASMRIS